VLPQPGVLAEIPSHARYLTFRRGASSPHPREALERFADPHPGSQLVFGLGASLVRELGATVPGLREFPASSGPGFSVPSTPAALWVWLRSEERGELVHETRRVEAALAGVFVLDSVVDAFRYRTGLDLTGYEDGTENPKGADAVAAALVSGQGPGLDGSSFVAVQQWVHDFGRFESFSAQTQDHIIGRRKSDNRELKDGPDAAHVQRTEQEAPDPPVFLLRRSMPWADAEQAGLVFVAFGRCLDGFEYHLTRMTGAADRIADHLFRFTRPVTGAYFWCPPIRDGRADLRLLG
jgi:putative iron-dependent peroxidase